MFFVFFNIEKYADFLRAQILVVKRPSIKRWWENLYWDNGVGKMVRG